jgi:Flp pilus assembly protein TadD
MMGIRTLWLSALVALIAGCSTMGSSGGRNDGARSASVSAEPSDEERPGDAAATEAPSQPRAEESEAADSEAEPEPTDAFTAMMLERKRRDFPEFETTETGFTITEQIRIGADVRADYQRALQLLEGGSYDQGIALLKGVTERAPDVTAPYIDLGIAYEMTGELEPAEDALQKAAQLSPDHPMVHNELGIVYRRTGRFAEARQSYEKALELYPGFHFARRNLAVLCDLYLSDLDCALTNYQAYLDAVLTDEEVEIWVADIRNRLGQ